MVNTADVMCKVIPLYRVTINVEDKKHEYEYERHIIADSLQGLIEGIVDAELNEDTNFEENDRIRMYFDIQDFLLMPCKGSRCHGYHLFDIDEVDCAGRFASIDHEIWYDIRFSRDTNVVRDSFFGGVEDRQCSEPLPVQDVIHRPNEEEDDVLLPLDDDEFVGFEDVERRWKYRDAIMMELYHMAQASEYRGKRIAEMACKEVEEAEKAKKRILEVIAKEADRDARDAVATRAAGQEGIEWLLN